MFCVPAYCSSSSTVVLPWQAKRRNQRTDKILENSLMKCSMSAVERVTGFFVPPHFRSRERKDHRENFRSRGTFVPWNIRSGGAKSPRTFVPWNFRSCGTFAPQERMFQELSFYGTFAPLEPSLHKQLSCPLTFAPVAYLPLLRRLVSFVRQSCEATLISDNCT